MSAYEPCNFYAPFGDRLQAVPEFFREVPGPQDPSKSEKSLAEEPFGR